MSQMGIAARRYVLFSDTACLLLLLLFIIINIHYNNKKKLNRKFFSTTNQSVVEQCMTLFECHHIQETIRERKTKFTQKFRMSSNQLCVTFRDKASADLELQ